MPPESVFKTFSVTGWRERGTNDLDEQCESPPEENFLLYTKYVHIGFPSILKIEII